MLLAVLSQRVESYAYREFKSERKELESTCYFGLPGIVKMLLRTHHLWIHHLWVDHLMLHHCIARDVIRRLLHLLLHHLLLGSVFSVQFQPDRNQGHERNVGKLVLALERQRFFVGVKMLVESEEQGGLNPISGGLTLDENMCQSQRTTQ